MAEQSSRVFISYSSADFEFVDKLDADLQARGFQTWVDRRRLVVGQHWSDEIAAAIEQCSVFLLVLTPTAVKPGSYVEREFVTAQQHNKTILPLTLKDLNAYQSRPTWLASLEQHTHFANFTDPETYPVDLNKLCYAIANPALPVSTDYQELYHLAMSLHDSNPDRATNILQYIVDSVPNLYDGQVKDDLAAWKLQLYPTRVDRLCTQAREAHRAGQYGVEARSLEVLLALGNGDAEAVALAREFLPAAQQNREMLGYYNEAQRQKNDGHRAQAETILINLYKRDRYFRDPAGIARELGVELPATHLDYRIADENGLFQSACTLLQGEISPGQSALDVRRELGRLTYDLPDTTTFFDSMVAEWAESKDLQNAISPTLKKARETTVLTFTDDAFVGMFVLLEIAAIIVGVIMNGQKPPPGEVFSFVWIPVALAVIMFLCIWLLAMLRATTLTLEAQRARARARRAFERWRQVAERVRLGRIDTLKRVHNAYLRGTTDPARVDTSIDSNVDVLNMFKGGFKE